MFMDIDDAPVAMGSGPQQTGATCVAQVPFGQGSLTADVLLQDPLLQLRRPH